MPTIHLHALQLLQMARRASDRARRKFAEDATAYSDDSIVGVIIAAAACEAFVNEFMEIASDAVSSLRREDLPSALADCVEALEEREQRWDSVTEKYHAASISLSGQKFDEGAAPFQDFKLLVKLRNAIMHIKVAHEDEDHNGQRVTDALAQRRIAVTPDLGQSWFDRLMKPEVADWAHDSALAMIQAFLRLVPPRAPYDSLANYCSAFLEYRK